MTRAFRDGALGVTIARMLPSRTDYAGLSQSWRGDVLAGATVGVVALPLALAFGITTGLGAQAGLITAIVAGLVAGVFGGSSVQVSGPTGAMTVVLVPIVARYGADAVFVVGLMAGVLILAASFGRLGRYLDYIPWPVVEGFTVGIAVIIFLQQVPSALGVTRPDGENTAAVALRAARDAFSGGNLAAIGLVVVTVGVVIVAQRVHRALPSSLVAVVAATVIAELAHLDVGRIGSLPASLPLPSLPSTSFGEMRGLASAAFAIALLASLESRGITVLLKGPRPDHLKVLTAVGAIDELAHANHVFDSYPDALQHARRHIERLVA